MTLNQQMITRLVEEGVVGVGKWTSKRSPGGIRVPVDIAHEITANIAQLEALPPDILTPEKVQLLHEIAQLEEAIQKGGGEVKPIKETIVEILSSEEKKIKSFLAEERLALRHLIDSRNHSTTELFDSTKVYPPPQHGGETVGEMMTSEEELSVNHVTNSNNNNEATTSTNQELLRTLEFNLTNLHMKLASLDDQQMHRDVTTEVCSILDQVAQTEQLLLDVRNSENKAKKNDNHKIEPVKSALKGPLKNSSLGVVTKRTTNFQDDTSSLREVETFVEAVWKLEMKLKSLELFNKMMAQIATGVLPSAAVHNLRPKEGWRLHGIDSKCEQKAVANHSVDDWFSDVPTQ